MFPTQNKIVRVAILDLYEGVENQGMRCIRELLDYYAETNGLELIREEFDVRKALKVPDLSFDIYISSGGPGSPLDSEGTEWENLYFHWLKKVESYNNDDSHINKKHVLFICHSFQLACRHYKVADVAKRKSTAFGVFPIHLLESAKEESLFQGLNDPFYAVDSRDYQVIKPHHNRLREMGATLLCIEKERPHVPLERAVMAIRFNKYMIGTQFHPEADAIGMTMYLKRDDKRQTVIDSYGFDKWKSMIDHLNDPDKILFTYSHIIPNFLKSSLRLDAGC
jgi:homoserine O-succinyltransferase/O-acetyltransferase